MKHLVIIGAGALGREMYWSALGSPGFGTEFDIKGYIVDDFEPESERYQKLHRPLLSSIDDYQIEDDDVFICAIGSVEGRKSTVERIEAKGGKFISIICPTALITENARIGEGTFISPYATVSDSAVVGKHVVLSIFSTIGHDSAVGDYTCIMPHVNITGHCTIGSGVFLGSGCRMTPSTNIGDGAYVGIGSVVLRRVKARTKVFGNPARVIEVME